MSAIQEGFVRCHFRAGNFSDIPLDGLPDTLRILSPRPNQPMPRDLMRVEYPEPAKQANPEQTTPSVTKETLIGHLMKDNKIVASELIEWIENSDRQEDIKLVLEGEKRKTVIAAGKAQMIKLIEQL